MIIYCTFQRCTVNKYKIKYKIIIKYSVILHVYREARQRLNDLFIMEFGVQLAYWLSQILFMPLNWYPYINSLNLVTSVSVDVTLYPQLILFFISNSTNSPCTNKLRRYLKCNSYDSSSVYTRNANTCCRDKFKYDSIHVLKPLQLYIQARQPENILFTTWVGVTFYIQNNGFP